MQNVFHNTDDFAQVGPDWIERLKSVARQSEQRRARLCLHRSNDDRLHEMIIALCSDCLFQPHRHPNKSESFHMIEGRVAIVIFDDAGTPLRSLLLTPPGQGGLLCYRMCTPSAARRGRGVPRDHQRPVPAGRCGGCRLGAARSAAAARLPA
jgi:cupin fold WbuC family metalloprotein